DSEVATLDDGGVRRVRFAEVARRARRLASALRRLGVGAGDRVGTFAWNSQEHLEAYLAVPGLGAVLHTINIRLFPEEVAYLIEHAADRLVIVDASLLRTLARSLPLPRVEHFVVVGDGDTAGLPRAIRYEELVAGGDDDFEWPDVAESAAAAMCYTSGTTGRPKGVVYSHRSTYLHSLSLSSGASLALSERDRILPIVPMFHANAWGLPYSAWMVGADLVLPGRFAHPAGLARLFAEERPTVAAAVPTVFRALLQHGEEHEPLRLDSLRLLLCGGAAVPESLMREVDARYGVTLLQAWGLTETSPLAALAFPPRRLAAGDAMHYRNKTGRVVCGVELRLAGESGELLPWDGVAEGEIEVRGPWVTTRYYGDPTPEKFHEGWLRTGDVGTVDAQGFIKITDRRKDVIKSGGEWISSAALENALMSHPAVREAAVIGVPDDKWTERPLACVVPRAGQVPSVGELLQHLSAQVARWWVPERWAFIDEVPKTSVGKFDKKVLRARYADGALDIVHAATP
ncbi:MAG TPA: long-chain fatty acid--CoA ligase, partial [Polyangia bacterium]